MEGTRMIGVDGGRWTECHWGGGRSFGIVAWESGLDQPGRRGLGCQRRKREGLEEIIERRGSIKDDQVVGGRVKAAEKEEQHELHNTKTMTH